MTFFKKLVIIQSFFEMVGMMQFLSNQLFLGLMSDCDNGLIVSADVVYGEVVPYGKKFSEWYSWATTKNNKPVNR